jgi:ABC-2 type transport system ATP-binding protein
MSTSLPANSSLAKPAAPPVIEVRDVVKTFGRTAAVDRASLVVPRGVVFALLGENGAGKTTLVRMLLGLLEADAGELRVLGLDSRREGDAIRRRVGYIPERPTLYEWMTASEIGWFTAGFYPDGFEHRYRRLLERYGVPSDCKLMHMSKGTRSKVVLSLALAHEPELLVLDEPTSGLDTLVRREFLESMVDLAAAGRTVLLSSHLIGEVERVADIVAIMRGGRVVLVEPLDELKNRTRELTVTVSGPAPPPVAGEVLRTRRRTRQWQVLVRDASEEELARLQSIPNVVAVESRRPSLEEIFVAYMQVKDSVAGGLETPEVTSSEATLGGMPSSS